MIDTETNQTAIRDLCLRLGVKRLDIFGSGTRNDYGPESDVDVLVRFDRKPGRLFSRYFELKDNLEIIFGRAVDLVIEDAIKNPYFRQAVEESKKNVYSA